MNIVLSTLNAKYIHTSLALRSIRAYCKEFKENIKILEFTINHQENYILNEIFKAKPDILGFSCYIWNIEQTMDLVKSLKKVLPSATIILGGPEVSYDGEALLKEHQEIDLIVLGEGEATFYDILKSFRDKKGDLADVEGIIYRINGKIIKTGERKLLDLNEIAFPYEDFDALSNQIIYYESTRGCPYQCQYCLSSRDKKVRFLSLERVYADLQHFLDAGVKQVKFVDRTFNCNKKHALSIWKYLMDKDNGKSNFHFEISADILDEEALELLSKARPGLFQFEIGVQTTNRDVLKQIEREMDFDKLTAIVKKIKGYKNIHQHLDLIAGLPGENYPSFKKSFNDVYLLYPEQLQLGFLKVLKGSKMRYNAEEYGLVYKDKAPYEILYTKELSYEEVLKLKMIEEMLELYFNSGHFYYSIRYISSYFDSPFDFYEALAKYWEKKGYHHINHSKISLFTILLSFYQEKVKRNEEIFKELLKFDMHLLEKVKKFPEWMHSLNDKYKMEIRNFYHNEENIKHFLPKLMGSSPKDISRKVHLELFSINITEIIKNIELGREIEEVREETVAVLFDYLSKDEILGHANFYTVII